MDRLVNVEVRGNIAVLTIVNPPVNAMTRPVVVALQEALNEAEAHAGLGGIVITGAGKMFVAGADIREIEQITRGEKPADMRYLNQLLGRVEGLNVPVVMAMNGGALGIGLEFAMAGHWRILQAGAVVGQPEVNLGVIPGAGGTQRLPRLAGTAKALEMIVYGGTVGALAARSAGIVDEVVSGDAVEAAVQILTSGLAVRRTCERDLGHVEPTLFAEFRDAAKTRLRNQTAPQLAIDAIEAAQFATSFGDGLEREAVLFEKALQSPQAKAMVYQFFAEREASRIPGISKETKAPALHRIGIVGTGTMGTGIASACLNAGIPVTIWDANGVALEGARTRIESLTKGSMDGLRVAHERVDMLDIDLLIEAVSEDLETKRTVFRDLGILLPPHVLMATNTSTLDVAQLATESGRPGQVCGIHFFAPATKMRLVEIVRAESTTPETLEAALTLARRLKKVPVVSGNAKGFIGNRIFAAYLKEAMRLVAEGARPEEVDAALEHWGMAMGPFGVMDLSGLDVIEAVFRELGNFEGNPLPRLVAAGRLGQKSGRGFYEYPRERRKDVPGEERLARRCLAALAQEGERVVSEGVALRPGDVDIAFVNGYGFPKWRGGPMFWGVETGLLRR